MFQEQLRQFWVYFHASELFQLFKVSDDLNKAHMMIFTLFEELLSLLLLLCAQLLKILIHFVDFFGTQEL